MTEPYLDFHVKQAMDTEVQLGVLFKTLIDQFNNGDQGGAVRLFIKECMARREQQEIEKPLIVDTTGEKRGK